MRYAQRGGYTPVEKQRWEWLRLLAAGRFARGDTINQIAHKLRFMSGSDGGTEAARHVFA
jgi:hypothetical protein